jgi:tetratricopeptide (TPR) repeat protein
MILRLNMRALILNAGALTAGAILMTLSPVFAAGGGGGGGGTPSQSTPQYDPAVEYQKGTTAFRANQFAEAAKAFRRVVDAIPENPQANYLLGASYMAQGLYKKAKKPLETAVKYDGKLIEARRDLAITYAKQGDAAKAGEQREALNAAAAACNTTCTDAAKITDALSKVDAALLSGKAAQAPVAPDIELADAKSADAIYVSAVSLINEKRYDEAIKQLNAALWTAGPHPDFLTYVGFANRKLHNYELAEGYYQSALKIAPEHRGALEYYGELKLERGNVVGAKLHLAKLESLCGFGCYEADELRRWIAEAATSAG